MLLYTNVMSASKGFYKGKMLRGLFRIYSESISLLSPGRLALDALASLLMGSS